MRLRSSFFVLLLLLGTAAASAQSNRNYGTVYSRYGLGERTSFSSSQSAMMGGASMGLRSATYAGIDNPALWSDQALTQLTVSAHVQGLRAEDASGERSELTSGSLGAIQLSLPLGALVLGIAAGAGEEALFRGALQPRYGIVLTSIVFALLHAPQYGLNMAVLGLFGVSVVLGVARNRYGTTTAMIAHS